MQILKYRFLAVLTLTLSNLSISCALYKDSQSFVKEIDKPSPAWIKLVNTEILELSKFSWIIVTDPAFASLNQRSITTVTVDSSSPEVLEEVFSILENNGQVDSKIYFSKESRFLKESDIPGIREFKIKRENAIEGRKTRALDHLALEILLMDAQKKYRVLIIETNTLIPYSSIFLELESAYWDGESETALRKRMKR